MTESKLVIGQKAYIPVDKDMLDKKNYVVNVRAAMDSYCRQIDDKRVISKDRLRWIMRQGLGLQSRKINAVINTFLDLGIISEYDKENYVVEFIKPFITLNPETVSYCLNVLSDLSFKVYCYLSSMYQFHQNGNYSSPWKFSVSGDRGLLGICGYSDTGANKKKMNWILETLQEIGLVDISDPVPEKDISGRFRGWYRYLYRVNDRSNIQVKVDRQSMESS